MNSSDLLRLQVAIVTGAGGRAPDKLCRYAIVTDLVRQMDAAEKPLGIICHGGLITISAGIDAPQVRSVSKMI